MWLLYQTCGPHTLYCLASPFALPYWLLHSSVRAARRVLPAAASCVHHGQSNHLLQVLIVQGGAVPNIVQHLNNAFSRCSCQIQDAKAGPCYCTCSKAAAARLLGRLCSDQVAQMQLLAYNPIAALLTMLTAGCKSTVRYHDVDGNELKQECEKSRWIRESAAEYALLKIACHCDEEFREHMLVSCIGHSWMGHEVAVGSMLF